MNGMLNVLIVDDEKTIRQGLKNTIDWKKLGFLIAGEAGTGEEAWDKIRSMNPDLVLLDIRMPRMYGTELIERARNYGYDGEFIILSSYSDFEYAQTAMQYGASCYLTKPIDEDELSNAVSAVRDKITKKRSTRNSILTYAHKAKALILQDLLKAGAYDPKINYEGLGLAANVYQVVLYESYTPFYAPYNFADILRVANQGNQTFEHLQLDSHEVIILKGDFAIERFNNCLRHYKEGPEKGSPLDFCFLTYGPLVYSLSDLKASYEVCCRLMSRRFFCAENQHVLSYEQLPDQARSDLTQDSFLTDPQSARNYSDQLASYIQSFNRRGIDDTLTDLTGRLFLCNAPVSSIKYFLIDILLQVRHTIGSRYSTADTPLPQNAVIMDTLLNKYYLYEITAYFKEAFETIMQAIGNSSSESVLDDIIYYIDHNYQNGLKLESLAVLFGYNSSYLGKLFKDKIGMNFNAYLDTVRIGEAKKLLEDTSLKIYEISAKVGYKNVDYFQQKFKKITGKTPSDFRIDML